MAAQKVIFSPPRFDWSLIEEDTDFPLQPDASPAARVELIGNQYLFFKATPTQVNSDYNPISGASTGAGTSDEGIALDGFGLTSKLLALEFTAGKVDSSLGLLANYAALYIGSQEVGRIYIDATADKAGQLFLVAPASGYGDSRFATSDVPTELTGGAIEADDNIFTKTGHGFLTGDRVKLTSLTGGTGVTAGQIYFFHKLSNDTGYLCTTLANAMAGTAINVTLDATNVVIGLLQGIGISLSQVDTNLLLSFRAITTDA